MRKIIFLLLILALLLPFVHAEKPEDVKLQGFVNDYAGVIDESSKIQINEMLQELYDNNTAQIAVVTVHNLNGQDIEGFAFKVAEGKLGDKEKDNGLLLLIAIEDRKYRFEVGRGLEPVLNDAKVGRIGRNDLVPAFKQEDYSGGILKAVQDIKNEINNPSADVEEKTGDWGFVVFLLVVLGLIFIGGIFSWISTLKKVAQKNKAGKYEKVFMAGYLLSGMMRGRGGFSGGVGGSGGGFGGFGGGSFGGGGAGGGW